MGKPEVLILMGGMGLEREVSLKSGRAVFQAVQQQFQSSLMDVTDVSQLPEMLIEQSPDVVFNLMHGDMGEDGHVAALCQLMGIAYVGSQVLASSVAMDKISTKSLLLQQSCQTLPFKQVKYHHDLDWCLESFGLPLCIKPSQEGSSVGVHRVNSKEALYHAYELLNQTYDRIMVEPWIQGREFAVGLLMGRALPVIEIKPKALFYDYDAKYKRSDTTYEVLYEDASCDLSMIHREAHRAADILGIRDWGRIDFLVKGQDAWILEANTIPGMTERSLLPMAAQADGLSYQELVVGLIQHAWRRCQEKQNI
ncbi:MAG: D-alanine--D-alanine ligase family protein [Candidatus Comchoanobacterales bacterium]